MKHVLVVEDDYMLLKIIAMILKRQGYEVYQARNGLEATEALRERDYDLVLTDIILPYTTGLELLGMMRNSRRHRRTPVVIVSAITNEDTLLEGFRLGADDYLKKPFAPGELVFRINRLLTAQREAS